MYFFLCKGLDVIFIITQEPLIAVCFFLIYIYLFIFVCHQNELLFENVNLKPSRSGPLLSWKLGPFL